MCAVVVGLLSCLGRGRRRLGSSCSSAMVDLLLFLVAGCFGAEMDLLAMASLNKFPRPDPFSPLPSTPLAALHLDGDEVPAMHGCWAGSAPPFLLPIPNNPIDSVPDILTIQFFPLSCWWPNILFSRSGDWFAGPWTLPAMEELGVADWQTPHSWDRDFSVPDQGAVFCREVAVMERSNSQTLPVISSMVICYSPPLPVASSKDLGALLIQSLLVSRKSGGMKTDGCCVISELHVWCLFVAATSSWKNSDLNHVMPEAYALMVLGSLFCEIMDGQHWSLKLGLRGVMCVTSWCFFCMLGTRMYDDPAEDVGSRLFGSIHQWQVRAPLLLIPRFNERESHRLSSVLHPQDLQLNPPLPLVHLPARLLGESPALRLASTMEAFEDFNCGCTSDLSLLTHHQTPVVVFPVFRLVFIVLVLGLCKDALMFSLFMRAL